MTEVYQSTFLLALGWAIAASIWQSGLIWLLYQLSAPWLKKSSAALRHNIALSGMLLCLVWFTLTVADMYNSISLQQAAAYFTAINSSEASGITDFHFSIPMAFMERIAIHLPYISGAYLIILLLLAMRLVNAWLYIQKIQKRGLIPVNASWMDRTRHYIKWLGIHKPVDIYLSELIDVPATINYIKPVILLPVSVVSNLTAEQVESVILHELSHIKRNDYLVNILVSVVETILFFNPFVYQLGKSLRKEREHSCDDYVLHFKFDPHSYASALLYLEQNRIQPTPLTAMAVTGHQHQLLERVKRIMNVTHQPFSYRHQLVALLTTAFVLIGATWLIPAQAQDEQPSDIITDLDKQMRVNEEKTDDQVFNSSKSFTITPPLPGLQASQSPVPAGKRVNSAIADTQRDTINTGQTVHPLLQHAPSSPVPPKELPVNSPVAPEPPLPPAAWNDELLLKTESIAALLEADTHRLAGLNAQWLLRQLRIQRDINHQQIQQKLVEAQAKMREQQAKLKKNININLSRELINPRAWDAENIEKIKELNHLFRELKGELFEMVPLIPKDSVNTAPQPAKAKRKAVWVQHISDDTAPAEARFTLTFYYNNANEWDGILSYAATTAIADESCNVQITTATTPKHITGSVIRNTVTVKTINEDKENAFPAHNTSHPIKVNKNYPTANFVLSL